MDSGLAHKRRRLAPACVECQRRKIRCDSATPCGPCSKLPSPRCIYSNVHYHPFPHGDFRSSNGTRLDFSQLADIQSSGRLDLFPLETTAHLRDDVGDLATYLGLDDAHSRVAPSQSTRVSFPDASASNFSDASTAVSRQLSTPSEDHTSWSSANSIFDPEPQQQTPSVATHGRIATCWEEAMNKCERLQFVLHGLRNKRGPIQLQSKHEPLRPLMDKFVKLERQVRASKHSAPSLSLNWTATPELPNYAVKKLLPPQRICDILLDAYLGTFESVLRILHVPSFLRDYGRFWAGSSSTWSPEIEELFLCKLVICIALGAFVNPELDTADKTVSEQTQDGIYWRDQAKTWIAYGRQWLARKAIAGSRADLNTAQIICLLALSRYTGPVNATSTGSLWSPGDHDLTRLAIQLGLHRDPATIDPDMPATEIEVRRRLWATMLELSLQLCLDHELPAPISPETYDCAPPSDLADEDASTSDADSAPSSYLNSLSPRLPHDEDKLPSDPDANATPASSNTARHALPWRCKGFGRHAPARRRAEGSVLDRASQAAVAAEEAHRVPDQAPGYPHLAVCPGTTRKVRRPSAAQPGLLFFPQGAHGNLGAAPDESSLRLGNGDAAPGSRARRGYC
ncbi:uncharacterized protein TrAtP1_005258 [Trichoderma atroviride]|uniref:uncharacterized protein n=1 Tax=Hypocrea atroviridis TaxID=63577 RepID=UPI003320855D|nr:hypothetical protein TrAtP1_005258 [Trichoderma atroviride]